MKGTRKLISMIVAHVLIVGLACYFMASGGSEAIFDSAVNGIVITLLAMNGANVFEHFSQKKKE